MLGSMAAKLSRTNPITFITLGTAGGPKSCKHVYIGKVNYVDAMFSLLNDETIHLYNPQCMANLPVPQQTCATSWKASQFIVCNSRNQMLFSLLQNHPEMLATTTPPSPKAIIFPGLAGFYIHIYIYTSMFKLWGFWLTR